MSLGIAIKAPEGIVLAAESRVTLGAKTAAGEIPVFFDNATKLWGLEAPNNHIGIVTYGMGAIDLRTAHSFQPEFEEALKAKDGGRLKVAEVAEQLSVFYKKQFTAAAPVPAGTPPMTFLVAGIDDGEAYGRIFQVDIPTRPTPVEHQGGSPPAFGITWGGQREFVDRIVQGYDHRILEILKQVGDLSDDDVRQFQKEFAPLGLTIPLQAMGLQDCVDVALFFIRTTIAGLELSVNLRGCGGHIDVATITRREGFHYVQRKAVVGETNRGARR